RDFFGALSLKKAQKGIFVTTSSFSPSAVRTAKDLGSRIVLVDGAHLARRGTRLVLDETCNRSPHFGTPYL
ncbi:MAG: restriction endonuclease, partial [Methyloceanibacter sp.]